MAEAKKQPNPIDIHVGSRVRLRRTMLGLSQEKLGEFLGVTFQQVQKYEKGSNRIGASRLQKLSERLNIPISFFFEGAPDTASGSEDGFSEGKSSSYVVDFLSTSEGLQLNKSFAKIKNPKIRKNIVELVRSLSEE